MLGVLQQTQLQELCAVLAGIGVSWQVRERQFCNSLDIPIASTGVRSVLENFVLAQLCSESVGRTVGSMIPATPIDA